MTLGKPLAYCCWHVALVIPAMTYHTVSQLTGWTGQPAPAPLNARPGELEGEEPGPEPLQAVARAPPLESQGPRRCSAPPLEASVALADPQQGCTGTFLGLGVKETCNSLITFV